MPFAIDWIVALAGLFVGGIVGLTGMGGGALMTPILVLLFGIPPSTAVASDLAASLFMKPLGAFVHMKHGTVNGALVRVLVAGSVPSAFAGAWVINSLGRSSGVDSILKTILGVALLIAASAHVVKSMLKSRHPVMPGASNVPIQIKLLPTLAIGVVGGFIVGMTSVGSGSLVIVALMLVYPRLTGSRLVGTDLAQAIPLVGSAALGHFVFGQVHFALTTSLLIGSIPGVYFGARYSAKGSDQWVRPVLVLVLVASAVKLLGASNQTLFVVLAFLVVARTAHYMMNRLDTAPKAVLPPEAAPAASEGEPTA